MADEIKRNAKKTLCPHSKANQSTRAKERERETECSAMQCSKYSYYQIKNVKNEAE